MTVVSDPVPVLGPFIGLVGSVLCSVAGALLLLAPFAFDYRQGAHTMPRSSVVDLATGGGVLVIGLLTTSLFGGSLRRRLRAVEPAAVVQEPEPLSEEFVPEQPRPRPEPAAPAPTVEPQPVPAALGDPGGALRDLLTPLVAALAADLRARENSVEPEGRQS
ncbi:MAG TPA: hypothetical protein VL551_34745 [Actinospica sp.]|nr:hypothetical protein [Actinospica sp.]